MSEGTLYNSKGLSSILISDLLGDPVHIRQHAQEYYSLIKTEIEVIIAAWYVILASQAEYNSTGRQRGILYLQTGTFHSSEGSGSFSSP